MAKDLASLLKEREQNKEQDNTESTGSLSDRLKIKEATKFDTTGVTLGTLAKDYKAKQPKPVIPKYDITDFDTAFPIKPAKPVIPKYDINEFDTAFPIKPQPKKRTVSDVLGDVSKSSALPMEEQIADYKALPDTSFLAKTKADTAKRKQDKADKKQAKVDLKEYREKLISDLEINLTKGEPRVLDNGRKVARTFTELRDDQKKINIFGQGGEGFSAPAKDSPEYEGYMASYNMSIADDSAFAAGVFANVTPDFLETKEMTDAFKSAEEFNPATFRKGSVSGEVVKQLASYMAAGGLLNLAGKTATGAKIATGTTKVLGKFGASQAGQLAVDTIAQTPFEIIEAVTNDKSFDEDATQWVKSRGFDAIFNLGIAGVGEGLKALSKFNQPQVADDMVTYIKNEFEQVGLDVDTIDTRNITDILNTKLPKSTGDIATTARETGQLPSIKWVLDEKGNVVADTVEFVSDEAVRLKNMKFIHDKLLLAKTDMPFEMIIKDMENSKAVGVSDIKFNPDDIPNIKFVKDVNGNMVAESVYKGKNIEAELDNAIIDLSRYVSDIKNVKSKSHDMMSKLMDELNKGTGAEAIGKMDASPINYTLSRNATGKFYAAGRVKKAKDIEKVINRMLDDRNVAVAVKKAEIPLDSYATAKRASETLGENVDDFLATISKTEGEKSAQELNRMLDGVSQSNKTITNSVSTKVEFAKELEANPLKYQTVTNKQTMQNAQDIIDGMSFKDAQVAFYNHLDANPHSTETLVLAQMLRNKGTDIAIELGNKAVNIVDVAAKKELMELANTYQQNAWDITKAAQTELSRSAQHMQMAGVLVRNTGDSLVIAEHIIKELDAINTTGLNKYGKRVWEKKLAKGAKKSNLDEFGSVKNIASLNKEVDELAEKLAKARAGVKPVKPVKAPTVDNVAKTEAKLKIATDELENAKKGITSTPEELAKLESDVKSINTEYQKARAKAIRKKALDAKKVKVVDKFDTPEKIAKLVRAKVLLDEKLVKAIAVRDAKAALKGAKTTSALQFKLANDIEKAGAISLTKNELAIINTITPDMSDSVIKANLKHVYESVADRMPVGIDGFNNWRKFAMLANPKTHLRNIEGNSALWLGERISKKLSGAVQDALGKKVTDATSTVKLVPREVKNNVSDYVMIHKDEITKTMGSSRFREVSAKNVLSDFKKMSNNTVLDKAMKINFKALEVGDDIFGLPAYKDALANQMSAKGIMNIEDVTEDMFAYALNEAKRSVYKQDNAIADIFSKIKKIPKVGTVFDVAMPFTKTPANVLSTVLDYSPVGAFKGLETARKAGGITGEVIDQFTRAGVGSLTMYAGAQMYNAGYIRLGYTGNSKEEEMLKQMGRPPNTLFVFGHPIDITMLSPMASALFMGASFEEARKDALDEMNVDGENYSTIEKIYNNSVATLSGIGAGSASALDNVLRQSYLQGLAELFDTGYGRTLGENIINLSADYIGQSVPTLLGQVQRSVGDRERKQVDYSNLFTQIRDQFNVKALGGIGMPNKIDMFGDVQKYGGDKNTFWNAINQVLNPLRQTEVTSKVDVKVKDTMFELYEEFGVEAIPTFNKRYFTHNKEKVNLNPQQISDMQAYMGERYTELATTYVNSSAFEKSNNVQRLSAFKAMSSNAGDFAKKSMLQQMYEEEKQETLDKKNNNN